MAGRSQARGGKRIMEGNQQENGRIRDLDDFCKYFMRLPQRWLGPKTPPGQARIK